MVPKEDCLSVQGCATIPLYFHAFSADFDNCIDVNKCLEQIEMGQSEY